jgi:hypothetical protein
MTQKVDFKKTYKHLYNPTKEGFHLVDVPDMNYLMLDGKGNPNTSEHYRLAVEALYSMSYGIKFALKAQGYDYSVPPLEGLWWMANMNEFTFENINSWEWTMMIMQPEWVTDVLVENVRETTFRKKKLPLLKSVRFELYKEGLSIQILYTGAYQNEAPVIAEMHKYINFNGYQSFGKHHEIYLSDPRKTSEEKLHTILRQPVRKEE